MSSSYIRRAFAATATIAALGAVASTPAFAVTGQITEFNVPTANAGPFGITQGPDGNVWFTEHGFMGTTPPKPIGQITPSGHITEFPAGSGSEPDSITTGPDGNLWFTDPTNNDLGKMTPSGTYTAEASGKGLIGGRGIAAGPDGNLYVVIPNSAPAEIAEVSTAGVVLGESPIVGKDFLHNPPNPDDGASNPQQITAGPDGNMWFTETNTGNIGRVNLKDGQSPHTITEFPSGLDTDPRGIVAGPDGKIWFTQTGPAPPERIGHIDIDGSNYQQTDKSSGMTGDPEGIAVGQDGGLWFTLFNQSQIGRASTTSTALTQFSQGISSILAGPRFIAAGADGNMWFTEEQIDKIGRVIVDKPIVTPPPTTTTTGTPPPPPPPPVDKTAPSLSRLSISPKRFYAGQKSVKITFSLSEKAAVSLRFEHGSSGRSVGGKCVKATHANRHHTSCTRFATTGPRLDVDGKAGANAVTFSGRIAGKTLATGTYKLAASAVDAALNHGKTVESSSFTVVTKPKKHTSKHHR
jgi:streptogramin lyase